LKKNYCILIPGIIPTGPIKGAIALANAIADKRTVKLVSLKSKKYWDPIIDPRVDLICLEDESFSWFAKRKAYSNILAENGGRKKVLSLSMCFSADILNFFCRNQAQIFSSVRGNLPVNYRLDYGILGTFLAYFHLILLGGFDYVSVMSKAMAKQVSYFCFVKPLLVGNFIDEKPIDNYRKNDIISGKAFRFIFIGSLTERKQPLLLVEAIRFLCKEGHKAHLDIVGSGPLSKSIAELVKRYDLGSRVILHGQIDCPLPILSQADAFVLPSLSEGISRAALEALHIGLPCVLRLVDGNDELIQSGTNGILFDKDENLLPAMRELLLNSRRSEKSLLPTGYRQKDESNKILNYVEKNDQL
jgi:glycosyltransferase involved in cell wall biosynthesis